MYLYRNGEPTDEYLHERTREVVGQMNNLLRSQLQDQLTHTDDLQDELVLRVAKLERIVRQLETKLAKARKEKGHARAQQKGRRKNLHW